MSENSFFILGSSSGLPQAERATSGYLLKTGESLTLIDCGGGVVSSFLRRRLNPNDVDRVFISHTHSDHVCELSLFIQLFHVNKREKPLDLYLPEEFIEPFINWLNAVYMFPDKEQYKMTFHPVTDRFEFDSGLFKATAHQSTHLVKTKDIIEELNLPNKMQCFSYKFQVNGKSLLYSADIGSLDDIKPLVDGSDFVIVESTHIDMSDFISYAQTHTSTNFILTHLGTNEEIAELSDKTKAASLTNIQFAMDGMEVGL